MPNLSIKNVPDSLLEKLRERAAQHHRSIQGELMALLSAAVEPPSTAPTPATEPPRMRRTGTRRIEEIAAEHQGQRKKPLSRGPRAVDLIRSERDTR